jgi:hypothetical protein
MAKKIIFNNDQVMTDSTNRYFIMIQYISVYSTDEILLKIYHLFRKSKIVIYEFVTGLQILTILILIYFSKKIANFITNPMIKLINIRRQLDNPSIEKS